MTVLLAGAVAALALAATASAAGTAPTNTSAPTITGTAKTGQTLTAQPGTWSGTQPISFTYQWQLCDENGNACTDVTGSTQSTYDLTSSDRGHTLRVRVTAKNSAGSSSATSAPTAVVTPPAIGPVTLNAGRTLVVYKGAVTISGMATGAPDGATVTIRGYHNTTAATFPVATVTVGPDGSFSTTFHPIERTTFIARIRGVESAPVTVNVQPRVIVHKLAANRFRLDVLAARPLVGRFVLIQRWRPRLHLWTSVQRVYLSGSVNTANATISTALTRLRIGRVMTRVYIPFSQARPGYTSGTSGAFTA